MDLVGLWFLLAISFTDHFSLANARAQLLTVPPYAVAAVVMCLFSYTSDRLQSRGMPMSVAGIIGGIGYLCVRRCVNYPFDLFIYGRLLLTVQDNNHVRYFATFCITSGTYTVIGIVIAWCAPLCHFGSPEIIFTLFLVAHNLGSETKKATGTPMYMAIGQCGSVLGSHIYPSTEGPRYM